MGLTSLFRQRSSASQDRLRGLAHFSIYSSINPLTVDESRSSVNSCAFLKAGSFRPRAFSSHYDASLLHQPNYMQDIFQSHTSLPSCKGINEDI